MSALSFLRLVRRVPGLTGHPELPNLESFLESEGVRPHQVYRILEIVIPTSVLVFGGVSVGLARWSGAGPVPLLLGGGLALVIAAAAWYVFHRLDGTITGATRRIRGLAEVLLKRYAGCGNIMGVEPAVDGEVGAVLDEAAGIYVKHAAVPTKTDLPVIQEARADAVRALESAMASLMELARPVSAAAQRQALAAGWAHPLLAEMRELDRTLDAHARNAVAGRDSVGDDPLAGLRDARLRIEKIDSAIDELEDRLSH